MNKKSTVGTLTVLGAYVCWGFLTIFWNLLSGVNPVYILAHRIVWSMVFMGLLIPFSGHKNELITAFKSKKTLATCLLSGALVTVNWGVYIYAVNSGHVLDASMGYFIEPVLVSLIGMFFFKEKPGKLEKVTFMFAVAGLIYIVASSHTVPALALLIAGSFAIYGAVKKQLNLSAQTSLFIETLFITPLALVFIIAYDMNSAGGFFALSGAKLLLFPACGIVTSVPLLLFNIGVKKIPYYVSGLIMYINPTLQFLMGILYFHEEFNLNRLIAFVIIGIGSLFTIYDKIRKIKIENKKETVKIGS